MIVHDLMTPPLATCRPDADLAAVAKLMWDHDCGFVPVIDGALHVAGVITDRDICMAVATRRLLSEHISAAQVMSSPAHACFPEDSLADALATMKTSQVRRLPVIDTHGRLQGVLSLNDLVLASSESKVPAKELLSALAGICAHRHQPVGAV